MESQAIERNLGCFFYYKKESGVTAKEEVSLAYIISDIIVIPLLDFIKPPLFNNRA